MKNFLLPVKVLAVLVIKIQAVLVIVVLAPLLTRAQKSFTISGQMPAAITGVVFLSYEDENKVTDSTVLKDGKFTFSGLVSGPVGAVVYRKAGQSSIIDRNDFYLQNEPVSITTGDSLKNALITSPLNDEYKAYLGTWDPQLKRIMALKGSGIHDAEKIKDTAEKRIFMDKYHERIRKIEAIQGEIRAIVKLYIQQHPDSYFSLMALSMVMGHGINADLSEADSLYSSLTARVRNTRDGRTMAEKFQAQHALAIGSVAPSFEQKDVNGSTVQLSDFKGKYVLIDFWASWCIYCRLENPNLVRIYNKYKDRNFTVLGVTLDVPAARDKWLDAIKKDGLPWTQVSDPTALNNPVARQYDINGIPQNVLVGPDGRILAKDLMGEALAQKLQMILGQ